jgi:gliding motility-associated-like protein
VEDHEKPSAVCKNIPVVLELASGLASIEPEDLDEGSSDNCGILTFTASKTSFNCTNLGANNVVLTLKDASGNESSCTSTVTVQYAVITNPLVTPLQDTICSGTNTNLVLTNTLPTSWEWTATAPLSITGHSAGSGNNETTISQALTNGTIGADTATYRITPKFYGICIQPRITAVVWVEPKPRILLTVADTLCNDQSNPFTIKTNHSVTGTIVYNLTATPSDSISGYSSGMQRPLGDNIFVDALHNSSFTQQSVKYTFTPRIIYSGSSQYCQNGQDTTVEIWVNPTPRIRVGFTTNDSICFTGGTTLNIYTPNYNIIGDVKYSLYPSYVVDSVTGVAAPLGNYPIQNLDQSAIRNNSNSIQNIQYKLVPFIDRNSSYCTNGIADSATIALMPEIKYDFIAKEYIGGRNISCYKSSDGRLNIKDLRGGLKIKGYSYKWIAGTSPSVISTADYINGVKAGSYTSTVTDKLGCYTTKSYMLTEPEELIANAVITPIGCNGGPTGQIELAPTGGTPGYKYDWKGTNGLKSTDKNIYNLISDLYTLSLRDTNNCLFTSQYDVPVRNLPGINISISKWGDYQIRCFNQKDGSIDYSFSSEISGYTFVKDNIDTLEAKNTIIVADEILSFKNLDIGSYKIFVNTVECSDIGSPVTDITQPSLLIYSDSSKIYKTTGYNIECEGGNNGNIAIYNVSGAHGNYQYKWTTPDGSGIINNDPNQTTLTAGKYYLRIESHCLHANKDTAACYAYDTITLMQPAKLIVKDSIPEYNGYDVACNGQSTGKIYLNVTGGTGPYTYNWATNNGGGLLPANRDQTTLKSGEYQVDVTYSGTCTHSYNYTLTQPDSIAIDPATQIQNVSCYGLKDGFIKLALKGGISTYNLDWTAPGGEKLWSVYDQYGLVAGIYTIGVTDQNNCFSEKHLKITQPDLLELAFSVDMVQCASGANGGIEALVKGGTPAYSYTWNTGSNASKLSGVGSGWYTVTVKDQHNCTVSGGDSVKAPSLLQMNQVLSDYHGANVSCYNATDGSAGLQIIGGVAPYRYLWSNGDTASVLRNIGKGTYSVTVWDKNNCKGLLTVSLTQPDLLELSFNKTDSRCYGTPGGAINLSARGGTQPYQFLLSSGQTGSSINNLFAGQYKLSVIDANNCITTDSTELTQPDTIGTLENIKMPSCPDAADGELTLGVSGGVAPYRIDWKDGLGSDFTLRDIRIGTYICDVTDFNNCVYRDTVEVTPLRPYCLSIPTAISPNGDGANDEWVIMAGDPANEVSFMDMYPEGVVEIYSRWGNLLFRSAPGYPRSWNGSYNGRPLPIDSYYFVIDPKNGKKPIKGIVTIIK